MKIRKGNKKDILDIMLMYNSCVKVMIKQKIDQWDETYPNKKIILKDIDASTYYVAEIDGEIIGGVNIDNKQDATYLDIKWNEQSNAFLVVHRLAIKEQFWNKKIGKKIMCFAEDLFVKKGLKTIRLDTYSGNPKAMEFYSGIGYTNLGSINLKPNRNKYYCFEKIII